MNPVTLSAIVMATISVIGTLAGMAGLFYRVGRLVGSIEAMTGQMRDDTSRLERDIASVEAGLRRHETWHSQTRRNGRRAR